MYKHTTHNTSSARWCHSVIPGLRLTSPPNLIAVIMAWRWNKSFFGGWALHDCFAVAGYKGPPHKRFFFPVHLVTHIWGVDSKDSTGRVAFVTETKVIDVWTLFKYEERFKRYFSRIFKSNTAYMFEFSDALRLPVWENDQESVLCINSLIFQFIFFYSFTFILLPVLHLNGKTQWSETGNILLFLPSNKLSTHSNTWGNSFNVKLPC